MHKFCGGEKLAGVLCVVLAATVALVAMGAPLVAAAIFKANARFCVVLDAGHGGADAGVLGTRSGVKESDLNLKITKLVGEYLESGGIRVVYTRTNDAMHAHANAQGNKKRADMFYRADVINAQKPDAVLSVHMNFFPSPVRRGAQAFFDGKNEGSAAFAKIVQEILNRDINVELGGREYAALRAEKYLLACSPYPTVIAECGFLSNPLDEAALSDPVFQTRIAYALFEAVVIFLNTKSGM